MTELYMKYPSPLKVPIVKFEDLVTFLFLHIFVFTSKVEKLEQQKYKCARFVAEKK